MCAPLEQVEGGQRVPIWLAAGLAVLGAVLMAASYAPAALWAPLLLVVTFAYVLCRTR